jgi:hypothetical protein
VAKVGTSKTGSTISQQAAVHPWLAADAHVNKQTNNNNNNMHDVKNKQWQIINYRNTKENLLKLIQAFVSKRHVNSIKLPLNPYMLIFTVSITYF